MKHSLIIGCLDKMVSNPAPLFEIKKPSNLKTTSGKR